MDKEDLLLITAHTEFLQAAIAELQHIDARLEYVKTITPEIALCRVPDSIPTMRKIGQAHPTFVRHLAPVQHIIEIANNEQDIGQMALAIATLPTFTQLQAGTHFSVQSRFTPAEPSIKRAYTTGQINRDLAEAFAGETGAIESIKKPVVVISILCSDHHAYLGISTAQENLSSWPGGARHYAQTEEQISRAEFKLLEALEVFEIAFPTHGRALDLGAAPGGWTRILLEKGLSVIAVDPAQLDPRLANKPNLLHYRGYAEQFIQEAINKHQRFYLIVNDMRMDARDAARLLVKAAACLSSDGLVISTLKLPHKSAIMNPLSIFYEAEAILQQGYDFIRSRQLFHNRQEVTVLAARPRITRQRASPK